MLSVVIPTYNEEKRIFRWCLGTVFKSLEHSGDEYEVIVVDSGSTDKTLDIAEEFGCKIYVTGVRSIGWNREIGITRSKGDVVCNLDADCIVTLDYFAKVREVFDKYPHINAICARRKPLNPNIATEVWLKLADLRGICPAMCTSYRRDYILDILTRVHFDRCTTLGCDDLLVKRHVDAVVVPGLYVYTDLSGYREFIGMGVMGSLGALVGRLVGLI